MFFLFLHNSLLKLIIFIFGLSAILLSAPFISDSFGFGDYDYLYEWGSFGINDPGKFSHPQFVAVDDDGNLYITDLGNKRVQKLSSSGEYILDWGQSGKKPGEFHYPSGIAVSDDAVFVADRDLNRVQKFSLDGKFIVEWGTKGNSDGQFLFPNGIAVHDDIVYVVDTGNQRIQYFSTNGEFISSFGSSGINPGQFLTLVGIDIDSAGNVYVADKGNGKIEKFSSDGVLIKSYPFYYSNYNFSPESLVVDPSGKIFVVNSANDRILHLSQSSGLKLNIFDQIGPLVDSFDVVTDVAIGINGELLVVDSANHTVKSFETTFYVPPTIVPADIVEIPSVVDLSSDHTKPVIVVPDSLEIEADDMFTVLSFGNAMATDENGINTIINNAPARFSPGITTITWIAFDNAGNSSHDSQRITVKTCGNFYSDYNVIQGTDGDDVIQGTDGDDLIFGLSGDDLILGNGGNDCIFAGDGNDVVSAGDGNDVLKGNAGNDVLKGNAGDDIIFGNSGVDVMNGENGNDGCYSPDDSKNDLTLNCEK